MAVLGTTVIVTWASSPEGLPMVFCDQLSSLGLDGDLVCGSGGSRGTLLRSGLVGNNLTMKSPFPGLT